MVALVFTLRAYVYFDIVSSLFMTSTIQKYLTLILIVYLVLTGFFV